MRSGSIILLTCVTIGLSACSSLPTFNSSAGTWGKEANTGKAIYAKKCSNCHGSKGQGDTAPAVIGTNENLGKYETAQELLDYISASMPFYEPGSLPKEEYMKVLAVLLAQNEFVKPDEQFNAGTLKNISLK